MRNSLAKYLQDLKFLLKNTAIAPSHRGNEPREQGQVGPLSLERDQIKDVPLQTILNWVSASGWVFRQFAASGDDDVEGYRVYLFTRGHAADPTP